MLFDESFDFGQFSRAEAIIGRQRDRLKPEFRFHILASHMDMWRLVAFTAVKMKPIWAYAERRWHGSDSASQGNFGNEDQFPHKLGSVNNFCRGILALCAAVFRFD